MMFMHYKMQEMALHFLPVASLILLRLSKILTLFLQSFKTFLDLKAHLYILYFADNPKENVKQIINLTNLNKYSEEGN